MEERPRLRSLELVPVMLQGRQMVRLRDPMGPSEHILLVSPAVLPILALMDGTRTVRDIQARMMLSQGGVLVYGEEIENLVRALDQALFLDSEACRQAERDWREGFRLSSERPARHEGMAYPGDPDELAGLIDRLVGGADLPLLPQGPLVGLVAPHIDIPRGMRVYGQAYRALREAAKGDIVVVLGTAHGSTQTPLVLTRKAFRTPLGLMPCHQEAVDILAADLPFDPFADEIVHLTEHSVEIQVPFLQRLLPGASLVPVLCGAFSDQVQRRQDPVAERGVEAGLRGLRALLSQMGSRVILVASADLAHVGPAFGSTSKTSPALLSLVERADQELLRLSAQGKAKELFDHVAIDGNQRHICGLAPLYYLHSTLQGQGALIGYDQWFDSQSGDAVTFGAVGIYGPGEIG